MNKKEIIKFGYNYAYDCGKETYTPDVLYLMYNLFCGNSTDFKSRYKKSMLFYQHGAYGSLCINPFKKGSKQYKYFTEGVLKASKEMILHNEETENQSVFFEDWSFDGELDASFMYSKAIEGVLDDKLKKKCQALLEKYEEGIASAIKLVKLLPTKGNSEYTIFDADIEELEERLK